MGKVLKKISSIVLTALIVTLSVFTLPIRAATNDVVVHVKDGSGWGSMNVYNWGDKGETAGPWPGTVMKEDTVEGWFTYTMNTECDMNLVFSKNGSPQSGDVKGISKDAKEIWIVIGGEGEANDMGAATNEAVLYTKAEAGWPNSDEAVATTTMATENEDTRADGMPIGIIIITIIAIGVIITTIIAFTKKKSVK